ARLWSNSAGAHQRCLPLAYPLSGSRPIIQSLARRIRTVIVGHTRCRRRGFADISTANTYLDSAKWDNTTEYYSLVNTIKHPACEFSTVFLVEQFAPRKMFLVEHFVSCTKIWPCLCTAHSATLHLSPRRNSWQRSSLSSTRKAASLRSPQPSTWRH